MSWLWGGGSSNNNNSHQQQGGGSPTAGSTHDDEHLKLYKDETQMETQFSPGISAAALLPRETQQQQAQSAAPLFMLDQLKHAGIPLKAQINPYLQMDPSVFRESQPQIIMPEGYESGRGRFEFALGYIGWAVIGGFGVGCTRGGLGEFKNPDNRALAWRPWQTRVLNATIKHGSGYAQTAGVAMFFYSVFELICKQARGADDLLNSFAAGPLAGALFRAPHGLRASGIGAAAGLGLVTLWDLCDSDSRRSLREMLRLA